MQITVVDVYAEFSRILRLHNQQASLMPVAISIAQIYNQPSIFNPGTSCAKHQRLFITLVHQRNGALMVRAELTWYHLVGDMSMSSEDLKASAVRFLQLASAGRVDEAYTLVAENFRHHNPFCASTALALKTAMQDNALSNPDKIFEVQRAIAERQMVVVHSKVQMPSKALTVSVVHLFRFESNQIAELWDVGQPQPTAMVNELGMF